VPYFLSERPYIEQAVKLFAAEGGQMDNRFAIQSQLREGMLGWTPVYCFDPA
jgi:hypothetical protein